MAITRVGWESANASVWTSVNPVLRKAQPGWELDTQTGKVGDGSTAWNDLAYTLGIGGGGGGGGGIDTAAIHAAPSKTTPADLDEIPVLDSASAFSLAKYTYATIKTKVAAYVATLAQTLTNKNLADPSNVFPTFNQSTTGNAGTATKLSTPRTINTVPFDGSQNITVTDATKVPVSRTVAGHPLNADVAINFTDLVGTVADGQQISANVLFAKYDGVNWVSAGGVILTGRPTSRNDAMVIWLDTTPTGAAPPPVWMLLGTDLFLRTVNTTGGGGGGGGGTSIILWYGTGLSNGHSIVTGDAGTGDAPAITSTGGTTTPTIVTTGGPGGGISVSFAQAAAQVCNLHITAGSTQATGRARFFFRTPASWYASSQGLFRFTDSSDTLCLGVTLRGSGIPGALSINDSTNANVVTTPTNALTVATDYRAELALDQTGGKARLFIYNTTGATVYDSLDQTGLAIGSTGWSRAVWGPTVSSVTTSMLMSKLNIQSDYATPIGTA